MRGRVAAGVLLLAGVTAVLLLRPAATPDPPLADTATMTPRVAARVREAHGRVVADPRSAAAWGGLGEVYHAHGLYDDAAACYHRASALASDDFRWRYLLALVRGPCGAEADEVTALLERAVALEPGYAPAWVRLGDLHLEGGRHDEARRAFETALRLDPGLAVAHRGLGGALLRGGDPTGAVGHLERAVALAPGDRAAWVALARACARAGMQGRADDAARRSGELEHALLVPDRIEAEVQALGASPQHFADRALALMRAGDHAGAIESLLVVAETKPHDPLVLLHLGTAYAAVGDLDAAVATLREARVHAPHDVIVLTWLGTVLDRRGDAGEALAVFREAVEAAPGHARARYNLATALMRAGRLEEAASGFREALRLDPGHADAHYNLGVILERFGRRDEAIEHFRAATRLDPDHPAAAALGALSPPRPR